MKTKLLLFATLLRFGICFAQSPFNIPDVKEEPKMQVRKTAVLFALLVSLAAASASATTINFASLQAKPPDPEVAGALMAGTLYTQQGLTIGTCCVKGFDVWKLGNSNFPGTSPAATSLFNYPVTYNTTTITYNGGQPFTLDSIDFAPLLSGGSGSFIFSVTGDCGDGCTVSQLVTISNSARLQTVKFSGFTNVLKVTFSQGTIAGSLGQPTAQQETAYQFNNIVVNNRYVNGGAIGNDLNNCLSVQTPCKTIGHAIALASSGDSIMVAGLASPATYKEHLTIGKSLNVLGAGASTTIVDGGGAATVVSVSAAAHVTLSGLTIRNGFSSTGAGIYNSGSLAVNNSTVTGNHVSACGGGIGNNGTLTINNSTISGNSASVNGGGICQTGGTLTINYSTISGSSASVGGGICQTGGTLTINYSTISHNSASVNGGGICQTGGTLTINNSTLLLNSANGSGGGIYNGGTLTISNATISGNSAISGGGGGIDSRGTALINNSTISQNSAVVGGGIDGPATLQNSIVASNHSSGNCSGAIVSNSYNLSSDTTCNFNKTGDLIANPLLGPLQNNGGPTWTMALLPGSPAIDAGNPTGCTDGHGHPLRSDQRGQPRPDKEDTGGCDMGAYESQSVK